MVDTPKIHRKPIIRLDVDEVANLLDIVEMVMALQKGRNHIIGLHVIEIWLY